MPGLGNRPLNNDEVSALRGEDLRILAEGWSGYLKGKVNPFIADAPVTTAYRVSQLGLALARERRDGSRFGLGGPLGELVIAETVVTYGIPAKQISLDCWRMNRKAAGLYVRLGFEHRAEEPDVWRPTLLPADGVDVIAQTVGGATINHIRDTRDHYQLHDHPLMRAA